jgi:hypothetical protein
VGEEDGGRKDGGDETAKNKADTWVPDKRQILSAML